jgi:GNAT superfamily N-acetyltransferase
LKTKLHKMSLQIKRAIESDIWAIVPLFDAYRVFYKKDSDIVAATKFLTDRIQKDESVIYIAETEGVAVGFCQLYPIFSSANLKRTWLLNDLYVAESARGKGVATALLQAAKAFGWDTEAKWLLLQTGADNKTAQSVYEKNGWQRVTDFFYEMPLR